MNFLRAYSKISRISYRSVRSFANSKRPSDNSSTPYKPTAADVPNDSNKAQPNAVNRPDFDKIYQSHSGFSAAGINKTSNTSASGSTTVNKPDMDKIYQKTSDPIHHADRESGFSSAGFNKGPQGDSHESYNSDARKNPWDNPRRDPSNPAKQFANNTAAGLRNLVDSAASTAQGFTDQVSQNRGGYNNPRGGNSDFINTTSSAAQGIANTAAEVAGATIKGFVDTAGSIASTFTQGNQGYSQNQRGYRNDPYNNSKNNSYNNLNPGLSAAQGFMNLAGSAVSALNTAASLFNPGTQRRDNRSRSYDNYSNNYDRRNYDDRRYGYDSNPQNSNSQHYTSTNTQFNSFHNAGPTSGFNSTPGRASNPAGEFANSARGFADNAASGAKYFADRTADAVRGFTDQAANPPRYDNYQRNDRYNNQHGSNLENMGNMAANFAGAAARGVANAASAFIPGAQRGDQRSRSQDSYYDNRPKYDNRGYNQNYGAQGSPQYYTSTNTQFNSFNASGPTSGFNDHQAQRFNNRGGDFASSTKNFAERAAEGVKDFADRAADSAKGFVDQATQNSGYDGRRYYNDNRNSQRGDPRFQRSNSNYTQNVNNDSQGGPTHFISTSSQFNSFNIAGPTSGFNAIRNTASTANVADDVASTAKSAADNVASGVKYFADRAAETANSFAEQMNPYGNRSDYDNYNRQGNYNYNDNRDYNYNRDNNYNSNYNSRYDYNSDLNYNRDIPQNPDNFVGAMAQRIFNNMYIMFTPFIAGGGMSGFRNFSNPFASGSNSYQRSNNDQRDPGYYRNDPYGENRTSSYTNKRPESNPGLMNTRLTLNKIGDGIGNVASGVVGLASSMIPSAGSGQTQRRRETYVDDNLPKNSRTGGQDFVYTGSQVDNIGFSDANKQGGATITTTNNSARDYVNTGANAMRDITRLSAKSLRKFSTSTANAAFAAANNFATAAGSAALSAAASAARNFNDTASSTNISEDASSNTSFIYTGSHVNENLTFIQTENKKLHQSELPDEPADGSKRKSYDVVISGAGVNGLALACALSHFKYFDVENKKILILDPREPASIDDFQDNEKVPDQRVVSLSLSSVSFLKELGVWSLLNRERIGTIRQMQVWEAGGSSFIKFNDDPSQEIGYVVETTHLESALYSRLKTLNNVQLELSNKITDLRGTIDCFSTVTLNDQEKISARLVVGSDGVNSVVKKKAKIASTGWSSNQHGIVCTVKTPYPNSTAWQRFLTTGPIAVLPLWDEYSSIVWSCENDLHHTLMQMNSDDFLKELNYSLTRKSLYNTQNIVFNSRSSFDIPPTITEVVNKRRSFILGMQQANRFVGERVALIGDAAHNIHPLAGQGLNLGLLDAAYLANVIVKNIKAGNDIGSEDRLREYEVSSMNLNTSMMYGLEFIKRSYEANSLTSAVTVRNLTTTLINNIAPLKSLFIDTANGKYFQPKDYEWKKIY